MKTLGSTCARLFLMYTYTLVEIQPLWGGLAENHGRHHRFHGYTEAREEPRGSWTPESTCLDDINSTEAHPATKRRPLAWVVAGGVFRRCADHGYSVAVAHGEREFYCLLAGACSGYGQRLLGKKCCYVWHRC